MSINTVTTDDLRQMNGKEGLVLQGCGPVQGYYLTLRGGWPDLLRKEVISCRLPLHSICLDLCSRCG